MYERGIRFENSILEGTPKISEKLERSDKYNESNDVRLSCDIRGATTITPGSSNNRYNLDCDGGVLATSWEVTCGTVTSWDGEKVIITWNSSGCSTGTITAKNGGSVIGTTTVTFYYGTLAGGSVSTSNHTITYNTSTTINATAATGGTCGLVFTYRWQSSTNGSSWTDISGTPAGNQNYTTTNLTSSLYFRRKTTCNGSTVYTSNSVLITVAGQLQGGSISTSPSSINYNTNPGTISASTATGGNCGGSYTYTWQSSSDGVAWDSIGSSNSQNFSPGNLTSSTYFRRRTVCGVETAFTGSVYFTVHPELIAGTASVASTSIAYNTSPGQISAGVSTGGGCSSIYNYQWQYSADGVSWSNITGATNQNYTPGLLTIDSSYRRQTQCGIETLYTNIIAITVTTSLTGGEITPYDLTVTYNTSPGLLSGTSASNGTCGGYEYLWQFSHDGVSWNYVMDADNQNYTPGLLQETTSFRREVRCGDDTAYSNIAVITITTQLAPGEITTTGSTISFNTSPGEIAATAATGGNCEGYSYQWQSSTDGINWVDITDATLQNYTPGNLTTTTNFRRKAVCETETFFTNVITVSVNGMLMAGQVIINTYTVESGTAPGVLTANAASGGGCSGSYTYRWQFSANGNSFGDIAGPEGEAQVYNPGNLTAKRFYRRRVICGTDTAYTTTITINIGNLLTVDQLNYIIDRTFVRPGITDLETADTASHPLNVRKTTQYFDGLGRLVQTVNQKANPDLQDVVMPNTYDGLGRETIKFMPFVSASDEGLYKPNPLQEQNSFNEGMFPDEHFYYGQAQLEASPLNRNLFSTTPGTSWAGANRGISHDYLSNTEADSVRIWKISNAPGSIPTSNNTYESGQLYKNITNDEHGKQIIEYKDKLGKLVLKKVQVTNYPGTGHQGWLCTYYVYDDFINLRFILQPKAVELITSSWIVSSDIAFGLCFQYFYDKKRRIISKKLPGSGLFEMIYDARNRLVMTRDSVQRSHGIWIYTQYDSLNRAFKTGKWEDNHDRAYHQNEASQSIAYPQPSGTWEILTETYYDDYSWVFSSGSGLSDELVDTHITGSNFITSYNTSPEFAQPIIQTKFPRNLVTGSKIKILGTSDFLYTVMFYDNRQRLIQTQSTNINNGKDITTTQFSFDGKPLRTLVYHQKNETPSQQFLVLTKTTYDAHGRLLSTTKKINDSEEKPVSVQYYNALGMLNKKVVGPNSGPAGNALDSLKYEYNIRGWLKSINADYVAGTGTNYFGMELVYDNVSSATGTSFTSAQYNGNIAGTSWKSRGNGINRKYDFTYDNINRLTDAAFLQFSGGSWNNTKVNFSVSGLSYDANGNILAMNQDGLKLSSSERIDSLIYTYYDNSNRLKNVIDLKNDTATLLGDFRSSKLYMTSLGGNKTAGAVDYTYDGNGNMIKDRNKDLGDGTYDGIIYNHLNLPQTITVRTTSGAVKGMINYTYDATGNKLSKVVTEGAKVTTHLYHGIFQYSNDTLQLVLHEEGRIRPDTLMPDPDGFYYDYFIKDHLGNVRMVLTEEAKVDDYPIASFETATRSVENLYYGGLDETEADKPEGFDSNIDNHMVSRLNYSDADRRIGPNILLRVMATDTVDISVLPFYKSVGQNNSNSSLPAQMIAALIGSFGGSSGTIDPGGHYTIGERNAATFAEGIYPGITDLKDNDPNTTSGRPKAYLNWLLFDEQFNLVSSSSGTRQVHLDVDVSPVGNPLAHSQIVHANGYLYVYVSNESPMNVYFDDFKVKHKKGKIIEENHYYPFGLIMSGINSKVLGGITVENKFKFLGKEEQRFEFSDRGGLEWLDFGARMYDNQIGRFNTIDPLSAEYLSLSPYQYGGNNPIINREIDGKYFVSAHFLWTKNALQKFGIRSGTSDILAHYASVVADHPSSFVLAFSNITYGTILTYWPNKLLYWETRNSQNTRWDPSGQDPQNPENINYNVWHSMRSSWEKDQYDKKKSGGVSNNQAMLRGMKFGWDNIFNSARKGKLKDMEIGAQGMLQFGQGIHALQDAYAHEGRHDVGYGHIRDDKNEINRDEAIRITESAVLTHLLISGDFETLNGKGIQNEDGSIKINTTGMSTDQVKEVLDAALRYLQQNN